MGSLPDHLKRPSPTLAPSLKILSGSHKGRRFRLLSSQAVLGRSADCDVVFKDNSSCSPRHALIKKEGESYLIKSLDKSHPVLVNKSPALVRALRPKDIISIGNIKLLFEGEGAPAPFSASPPPPPKKPRRGALSPPRLIMIAAILAGGFLFLSDDKEEKEKKELSLKTEADILEDISALEALNEEESEKKILSSQEKEARAAFIKGFRDYRKGYFLRALKMFQHCLALLKSHSLCQSYSLKSKTQIEKMIQTKIRLGNSYRANQQYSACRAIFKSAETMIQDRESAVYKEAAAGRKACEIQLENKI